MNRQREELAPLIRGVDSGSEVGSNVIPIVSDSEGFFTDGEPLMAAASKDKTNNNSNLMIKQEVEERIQRIEAEGLDMNRNEPVLKNTDRRPKSLEEKSSHKKRSNSRKHRKK